MYRYLRFVVLIGIFSIVISACNNVPEQAKYLPKNAIVVASVDIQSLTKKVAWNAITGSKLFQQMQKRLGGKNANQSFEDAGIDVMNTMYVYIKSDKRYRHGNRVTALIPLSDKSKWDVFVKNTFPRAKVTEQNGRKEAALTNGMYAGWNDKLLILMNVIVPPQNNGDDNDMSQQMTDDQVAAEMDNAFTIKKDNQLINNKHFLALQKEGHDIAFWMNYDELMTQYMGQEIAGMMNGLTLTNTFWKNAAFTAGFDFEKGKIAGDLKYYTSDEMKNLGSEIGGTNADEDMIKRLPKDKLDFMMAMHMSTKGTKDILQKMGVLGLLNVGLAQKNLDVDYVFDAISGDMAMAVNDFSMSPSSVTIGDTTLYSYTNMKPKVNFVYVLKINKRQNFDRLLGLAVGNGLVQISQNIYAVPMASDSLYVCTSDKYAVLTDKVANGKAYLQGDNKGKLPADANAYGHPMAMYFNAQEVLGSLIDTKIPHSTRDSVVLAESKRLLNDMSMAGGAYKDNAFQYQMSINFMNKDENSLLQIMDMAMRVSDGGNNGSETAYK